GTVERVARRVGSDAELRHLVPIEIHQRLPILQLKVRGDVLETRQLRYLAEHQRRHSVELVEVAVLQRVLVLALREPAAELNVLDGLEEYAEAGHARGLAAELLNHL